MTAVSRLVKRPDRPLDQNDGQNAVQKAADSGVPDGGKPNMDVLTPNVRAKAAPTVGRQGQQAENVHGTCWLALVARRWGSP